MSRGTSTIEQADKYILTNPDLEARPVEQLCFHPVILVLLILNQDFFQLSFHFLMRVLMPRPTSFIYYTRTAKPTNLLWLAEKCCKLKCAARRTGGSIRQSAPLPSLLSKVAVLACPRLQNLAKAYPIKIYRTHRMRTQ